MPSLSAEELIKQAEAAEISPGDAHMAIGLLDLTSLKGDETEAEIKQLCDEAKRAGVAAVCVYPAFLAQASAELAGTTIKLAAVTNFPHGSDDIAATAEESAAAVRLGAQEIDLVAPLDAIMEGDVGIVGEMVEACRDAVGPDVSLKIILETGRLQRPDLITAAARSAVMAGVDVLKTSTGKVEVGATLEAALTLLSVIQESDGLVGLKVSGGVRTADQAAGYLYLARQMMGEDWITPDHLRIGASSLLADLERVSASC